MQLCFKCQKDKKGLLRIGELNVILRTPRGLRKNLTLTSRKKRL